ncbi:hypothetical protein ACFH04_13375 [Streptomyces noboritoensis]|uniref:Uncharacterized protein n=1 Tax=Streptomyces noboritoensis TaxID=67337 RepID=A0ABV6TFX0_9ACTN
MTTSSSRSWHLLDRNVVAEAGPGVQLVVERTDGACLAYPHVRAHDAVRVLAVHQGRIATVVQDHYLHGPLQADLPGGPHR